MNLYEVRREGMDKGWARADAEGANIRVKRTRSIRGRKTLFRRKMSRFGVRQKDAGGHEPVQ